MNNFLVLNTPDQATSALNNVMNTPFGGGNQNS